MIALAVCSAPPLNRDEVRRYARIMGEDAVTEALLDECIAEAAHVLSYKVCFSELSVQRAGEELTVGTIRTASSLLQKALFGCERALLFAATIGTPFDRLITRYSRLSPVKALLLQALGAERVEALCDVFMSQYERDHACSLMRRVSPGYGDFPLGLQREIFSLLDCPRKLGLTLNDSLLMSPSKSVTAITGIKG